MQIYEISLWAVFLVPGRLVRHDMFGNLVRNAYISEYAHGFMIESEGVRLGINVLHRVNGKRLQSPQAGEVGRDCPTGPLAVRPSGMEQIRKLFRARS